VQKIYCYIDETGLDTEGAFFLVSVVITKPERDEIIKLLEKIEKHSRKERAKWAHTKDKQRLAYMNAIFKEEVFKGRLYYGRHIQPSLDYQEMTVTTAAQAITAHAQKPYKATVIIDGLPNSLYRPYAAALRKHDILTDKVKGADDNKDALLRLADALCGFVRDALEGATSLQKSFKKAIDEGYIIEVGAVENEEKQ
jgi:hypothetical protein